METLASILSGAGGNPYQGSGDGGGISPLLSQMLLARQMGSPQLGQPLMQQGMMPPGIGQTPQPTPQQQPTMGQPALPQGFGSLGALPALISGAY
jgi:hypothetical protein